MDNNQLKNDLLHNAARIKKELLCNLNSLRTHKQKRLVLQKYLCAIHPHFIVWVSAMQNSCISVTARQAAFDNIKCELIEDHQIMLYKFMQQIEIQIDPRVYSELFPRIIDINHIMSLGLSLHRGIGPATVIFFLEEISKAFIPWIEETAREFGATDFLYTEKHGEADEAHSAQALHAVLAEAQAVTLPEASIEASKTAVIRLLNKIFCI